MPFLRRLLPLLLASGVSRAGGGALDECDAAGGEACLGGDDVASLLSINHANIKRLSMGNLASRAPLRGSTGAPEQEVLDGVVEFEDEDVDISLAAGDPELETEELKEALLQAEKEREEEEEAEAAGKHEDGEVLLDSDKTLQRTARRKAFTLEGKSIYFLMTDRFARSGAGADNYTACDLDSTNGNGGWCGGTFKGITRKLPYIKGMGFDCIWISPPIDSTDYTGYFGRNFFKINKQWGTQQDLKMLSYYVHKLNMCLVFDLVTNHVRNLQVNGTALPKGEVVPAVPFSKGEDYHQLNKTPGSTFEQYVSQPPPYASSAQGSNDALEKGVKAGQFTCGPDNADITYCSCFPGNSGQECPGFSAKLQRDGWFGSLGDLNQTSRAVRSGLLRFVLGLKRAFSVDAIRLDTAIYQGRSWLAELQQRVGIEILGEATVNNLTYAGSFQRHNGQPVLKGLLNFPPFYWIAQSFCSYYLLAPYGQYEKYQGTWSSDPPNLTQVGKVIDLQQTGGMYSNLDLLGNFADNHDEFSRIGHYCQGDSQRVKNALALVFFMRGIPINYYGTEQGLTGHQLTKTESNNYTIPSGQFKLRESLWQTRYDTSAWQYGFIAKLNSVRRDYKFAVGEMRMINLSRSTMIFVRKPADKAAKSDAWVFLNNLDNSTKLGVRYCPGPGPVNGHSWFDALSDEPARLQGGCYMASDASPKLLVLKGS